MIQLNIKGHKDSQGCKNAVSVSVSVTIQLSYRRWESKTHIFDFYIF